jgi:hypothetical protein
VAKENIFSCSQFIFLEYDYKATLFYISLYLHDMDSMLKDFLNSCYVNLFNISFLMHLLCESVYKMDVKKVLYVS